MHAVHVSAYAGHMTLHSGVQHQGHALRGPHHHHRRTLRLDHDVFVVLGEPASESYILIAISISLGLPTPDRSSIHSLERVRLRLVLRHHDPLFMLIDYIAVNGDDGVELVRYDFHLVIGDVHLHGQLGALHGLDKNGVGSVDVIAGHEGPFVEHHERNHALV